MRPHYTCAAEKPGVQGFHPSPRPAQLGRGAVVQYPVMIDMSRTATLLLVLLAPLSARTVAAEARAAAVPVPPNVVLILADDLGYGELSIQGCADVPTPNIDSIATSGVRFASGYVTCPVCAPTRAGLLTGRYPQRFGFETNPGPESSAGDAFGLPRSEPTLAERLRDAGYATGMVGKWHIGYREGLTPPARGFDEFFGFLSGASSYVPRERRPQRILRDADPVEVSGYLTHAFGREAAAFIDRHAGEPFFLYLAFNAVHSPLQAAAEDEARFPRIEDSKRRTFAGMTAALDGAVGAVLERLRAHGLEERTLIFFLSDNGGPTRQTTSSNRPLSGFKGQLLEGGIRVPFLAQWKGTLPAGRVLDEPVSALDVVPTALAAAGRAALPEDRLDGVDLLPWLLGQDPCPPHDTLFWRYRDRFAIRSGDLKLVRTNKGAAPRLFDLAADPGETTDLAAERPEDARALLAAWEAWNGELMDPLWQRGSGRGGKSAKDGGAPTLQRFTALDKNDDGAVDRIEFLSSHFGAKRASLFDALDQDGDGRVTWDEVEEWSDEEDDLSEPPE